MTGGEKRTLLSFPLLSFPERLLRTPDRVEWL
jgi:hypothetical protein